MTKSDIKFFSDAMAFIRKDNSRNNVSLAVNILESRFGPVAWLARLDEN